MACAASAPATAANAAAYAAGAAAPASNCHSGQLPWGTQWQLLPMIRSGPRNVAQVGVRCPAEFGACAGDVRAAEFGVVRGTVGEGDGGIRCGGVPDHGGEAEDADFMGIAEVDRPSGGYGGQGEEAFKQVVDIAPEITRSVRSAARR